MSSVRDRGSDRLAYLLLAMTALCWAGNHITGRWMAADSPPVPPGGLTVVRWLLSLALLLPFAWPHLRTDWPNLRERLGVVVFLGLLGGAGFSVLQYYALRYTTAVNVGVMNSVGPAFIILAGITLFRDRTSLAQIGGIAVSLLGVLVIVSRGDLGVLAGLSFNLGDMLALVNMAVFAVYSACLRLRPRLHGLTFMTLLSLLASIGSLPIAIAETLSGNPLQASSATIFSVIYTGVFTSVVAYLAWNAGVARLGAARASAFLHLVPMFGALLSVLVLGEEPQLFHAIGLMLIVIGVTLAARPPR